jgi:hypothetical protein
VQYLHDKQPPTVLKLGGEGPIGNLTVGDAVDLLENNQKNEFKIVSNGTLINGTVS